VAVEPAAPLWPLPVVPIALPSVVLLEAEPLAVEPVAELPLMSLSRLPVALHAARDKLIMLLMRRTCIVFMIISLYSLVRSPQQQIVQDQGCMQFLPSRTSSCPMPS
jgi:hypothetical protein